MKEEEGERQKDRRGIGKERLKEKERDKQNNRRRKSEEYIEGGRGRKREGLKEEE